MTTIEINPLIEGVTIGSCYAALDCVDLGCLDGADIRLTMKEKEIICNVLNGPAGFLRYDARGEITLNPLNFTSANLAYALDAVVSTTTGNVDVTGEIHYPPEWTPDDEGTPTEWTSTILLYNPWIEGGTVLAYTNAACTIPWPGTVTESDICKGSILLTAAAAEDCDETVYFAYSWGTQIPSGSTRIDPGMGSFAEDHKATLIHKHAMTGDLYVYIAWRCQIVPDVQITFNNQANEVIPVIKLKIVEDSTNHPTCPLGCWFKIPKALAEAEDFDYEPFLSVPGMS